MASIACLTTSTCYNEGGKRRVLPLLDIGLPNGSWNLITSNLLEHSISRNVGIVVNHVNTEAK